MKKIKLNLEKKTANSYDICIGRDILDRAGLILAKNNWASRYAVITDSNVADLHGERVLSRLREAGLALEMISFPAGEPSKTIETALDLARKMMELRFDRRCAVIALGGGVAGDVAGFVSSIYMRSIPCIQMPTTLLAMVDASIGGKTGIDFSGGKNTLGTFHQPKAVFADIDFLATLPEAEFRTGLSEIIKYGVIDDAELFHLLEKEMPIAPERTVNPDLLERLIAKSVRIKKGIVEIDEKESGLRRILNFGHTLGHAIEAESGYTVSHGEAVSIGMIASALISEKMKYLPHQDRVRIEALVKAAGLPSGLPAGMSADGILSRIRMDKKKDGEKIHFVLIKKIGMPFINGGIPEPVIRETLKEMQP